MEEVMERVIATTAICEVCFLHFTLLHKVVFRKKNYYSGRYKLINGYKCPSCGFLIPA